MKQYIIEWLNGKYLEVSLNSTKGIETLAYNQTLRDPEFDCNIVGLATDELREKCGLL